MSGFLSILLVFGIILISMVLHEIAHGVVAYVLGDETAKEDGRLSLNPLVHLDPINSVFIPLVLFLLGLPVIGGAKPVPVDSRNLKWGKNGMALVALAGPMMNFLLAFLSFGAMVWSGLYRIEFWREIFMTMVSVNLGFMVFNLLPMPPLDGSRVIYVILPDKVRGWFDELERYGTLGVMMLLMVFSTPVGRVLSEVINQLFLFISFIILR